MSATIQHISTAMGMYFYVKCSIRWVESVPVYGIRGSCRPTKKIIWIDNERHDCCWCSYHSIGVENEAWFWIKHYPWQRTRSLLDCDDNNNNAKLVSSFTESDISRCCKIAECTAAVVRKTEIEIIGGMCEAEHHTWFCLSSSLLAARITAFCVCSTSSPIHAQYIPNYYLHTRDIYNIFKRGGCRRIFRHSYVFAWSVMRS